MKYIVFLVLISTSLSSIAQLQHLEEFYPENALYKKLHVKQVIDSSSSTISSFSFDTLGRIVGMYSYYNTDWDNPYIYQKIKDTLYRLKYREKGKDIYSFEKFVYSKSHKIISYLECREDYSGDNKRQIQMNDFFYDANDNLYCQIKYSKYDCPDLVAERMTIDKANLDFYDVIYYEYKKRNHTSIIIARHTLGKPDWRRTDTLFYNSKGQLYKKSSFAKQMYYGELLMSNSNRIEELSYNGNNVVYTEYILHCLALQKDGKCFDMHRSEVGTMLNINDSYGLVKERYSISQDNKKSFFSKYSYIYY